MQRKMLTRLLLAGLAAWQLSAMPAEAADAGMHVDQVGYLTGYEKVAMVTDDGEQDFAIVDAGNGKTVYKGKLSAAKKDAMSEETLRRADFTALKTPGTYMLKVGTRVSYPFEIGDDVYHQAAHDTWRSYTLSRSGTPINDKVTGLKVKMGHPQDRQATVYFTDAVSRKGDQQDVSGGWYDAGDYGKYTTTGSLASAELMLAYESNPAGFTRGQLDFPAGITADNKLPDALNEVKYELDFLQKMMRKDGSTYHKVSGAVWPGFDKSPDTDTQERFLYGTCTASTAMCGASFAIGARVYKADDAAYAHQLLKKAEQIWQYLAKNPQSVFRNDEGQQSGSGPYDDLDDRQERLWFAAEMYRTTGARKYEQYLSEHRQELLTKPGFFTWDNTLALAQFAYAKSKAKDKDLQQQVRDVYLAKADEILGKIRQDGFNCALAQNEYTWASTKNDLTQADMLLMAYQLRPEKSYIDGALDQVHYMFGRNSLDKSFLTGEGDNYPQHPHNRIHESTGAYVPGLLVGGPNAVSGGDPDQTAYLASGHIPTAKSYLDVLTSWSTNEYAIDYTGVAAYALAYFAAPHQH